MSLESIGVCFGVLSVWLIARERVWGWPAGLVNVAVFVVVFREARLYADMALQVFYIGLCLYGWHAWLHGGPGGTGLPVRRTPWRALLLLAAAGAVAAVAIGTMLHRHTDASLPFVDAGTTSFSLVAQWMQTRKWLENWAVWIAVDVVYIGMYVHKALYLTAGLYIVFLALAVLGWRHWRASLEPAPAA